MESCGSCGLCYKDPYNDTYRCMRGVREPVSDLFILFRTSCDRYTKVDLVIKTR